MKNRWQKDIRNRMVDLEIEEPQGLWDSICAAEGTERASRIGVPHGPAIRKWIWSAVAACLLIGWCLYPVMDQEVETAATTPAVKSEPTTAVITHRPTEAKVPSGRTANHAPTPVERVSVRTSVPDVHPAICEQKPAKHEADAAVLPSATNSTEAIALDSDEEILCTQAETDSVVIFHTPIENIAEPHKRHRYLAQANRPKNAEQRFSIGISSSGGLDNNSRQLYRSDHAGASTIIDDAEWKDSPLLGIMYLNRGVETQRNVTHHAPIRTELSLAYKIDDRWSVESGVTYAMVSSDISEGTTANYIEDEQKLHYVGVPIGVRYRAVSWKKFDVYLSSDVLSELCVSGTTTRSFILGDRVQQQETIPVNSHPLQLSAGAKVGAQYHLASMLSIYAEPGCRYYFDDHSSIDNVFKDRKLDFSLNMGLRFTIGR